MEEIVVLVVWGLIALIGRAGAKAQQRGKARQRRERATPVPAEAGAGGAREPTTLEELLAEMRGELERAKQRELPPAEEPEWDDDDIGEEVVPERDERPVGSPRWNAPVEGPPADWNAPLEVVSLDDDAEALVRQRIRAAERRNRGWRLEDHRQFDAEIRAPVVAVDDTARRQHHRRLREAIILREVLGPPKGME